MTLTMMCTEHFMQTGVHFIGVYVTRIWTAQSVVVGRCRVGRFQKLAHYSFRSISPSALPPQFLTQTELHRFSHMTHTDYR